MAKAKSAVPEGHHTVTPQLTLDNAAQAIEWYKKALGAEEVSRAVGPDGKIMHADLRIGNSHIMLNAPLARARRCLAGRWGRCRISSGAIAPAPSPTRTVTAGPSRRTRKISPGR